MNDKTLLDLVKSSNRILATSHISPDPDAVTSLLLVVSALRLNFPGKEVRSVLEERPTRSLDFLEGYSEIEFTPLVQLVESFRPDLFIITDANSYQRVSRQGHEELAAQLLKSGTKIAAIDHHEVDGAIEYDVLVNEKRPATAEQVYVTLFESLGLKKPKGYAETTLLGIVSDTQRHRFDHPGYRETYNIVSDLLDAGASIEKLEAKTERYTKEELAVMGHLITNITNSGNGYTYSYISDDFARRYADNEDGYVALKNAAEEFVNRYIKYYEGNRWGFVVYPEITNGKNWWGISFRAMSGSRDVAALANLLGGGGHKSAAGAKIQATNVEKAIEKVTAVTDDSLVQ